MALSKKRYYEFVVDTTPSPHLYPDKKTAVKEALRAWKDYVTSDMPHLAKVQYKDAVKHGIVWFSSRRVKSI